MDESQAFLSGFEWTPLPSGDIDTATPKDNQVAQLALAMLRDVCTHPFDSETTRFLRLNIRNRALRTQIAKHIEESKLGTRHVIVDSDGKRTLIQPHSAAYAMLQIPPLRLPGIGSSIHTAFYLNRLKTDLVPSVPGYMCKIEGMIGNKSVDCVITTPAGRLILIELEIATIDNCLSNLMGIVKSGEMGGVDRIYTLTATKKNASKLATRINNAAKNHIEINSHFDKISVMQFAQFASHYGNLIRDNDAT